jgi:hypothetical protein
MKKHRPGNVRRDITSILNPERLAFREISRSTKGAQVEI